MEEKTTLEVTLDEAREWYNSNNDTLKKIALKVFSKDELIYNFKDITTFKKACEALGLNYDNMCYITKNIAIISKASAAMFKLNIIRKALNLGQDLHLTKKPKDSYIYCPYNPFVTENSIYYEDELNSDKMEIIGTIKCEGEKYNILGGHAFGSGLAGLGYFDPNDGIGYARADYSLFGCANEEIAKHFGKYFGMLIIEAMYGRLDGFEVIEDKYGCLK